MDKKRELCACGKTKTPPYCDGSHESTKEDTSTGPIERFYYDLFLKRMERPSVNKSPVQKKIILTLLPVWSPLIPPQGIGQLKNFLQKYGYTVEAIDANSGYRFKQLTDADILEEENPEVFGISVFRDKWAKDMLITQTWIEDGVPSREELFDRVCRFTQHGRGW